METLHTIALIVHIVTGFTALLTGTTILLVRKGGRPHRRLGRVFFIALLGVAFSAFVLSVVRPDPFLFMVGVFTLYQVLGGKRAVRNRPLKPSLWDRGITLLGAANGVVMLASGQLVLVFFGVLSVYLVVGDVRTWLLVQRGRPVPRMLWLQRHIGHMMGSYIATVTAFLVVNSYLPSLGIWAWLAPTVAGVPLLLWWTRRFTSGKGTFGGAAASVGA